MEKNKIDIKKTRPAPNFVSKFKTFELFYDSWKDVYRGSREEIYSWWLSSGGVEEKKVSKNKGV